MWHFSENPRKCISEAEVFCGSILNRQGIQSRQQREASIRLKEETDRVMTWIAKLIHDGILKKDEAVTCHGYESGDESGESDREEYDALRLSWACLVVGCAKTVEEGERGNVEMGELQSFRVVAAACLLKELSDSRGRGVEERLRALDIRN